MQELRERLWANPAKLTDEQIEAELAALKLSEPGWELENRKWRLQAELKFRECKGVSDESG